jgi:hypothetical protein
MKIIRRREKNSSIFKRFTSRNFESSNDLETYAGLRLYRLSKIAPSDSNIIADLERFGVGYRFKLQVASAAETFSIEALANDAKEAINRLDKKMGASLSHWHQIRTTLEGAA